MSQVFRKSSNALARASLVGIPVLVGMIGWLVFTTSRASFATRQGEILKQPIPFSHNHHVAHLGIDCRYCHTAVEKSSSAGIPPTATCMNCHSQIWAQAPMLEPVRTSFKTGKPIEWIRVHDLPQFVYFNHSIHVAKGVGCETCHGRVDKMPLMWQESPLTMSWCLDCHRDPVKNLRPAAAITTMGWEPPPNLAELQQDLARRNHVQSKMSCSTCHR